MDSEPLAKKKCVPCKGGIPPLTHEEAEAIAMTTPEWSLALDARSITRRFVFEDFVGAIAFVNRVADIAEAEGHHPDIAVHWNKVDLLLFTHKIDGLHENDFILAAKIDEAHAASESAT